MRSSLVRITRTFTVARGAEDGFYVKAVGE